MEGVSPRSRPGPSICCLLLLEVCSSLTAQGTERQTAAGQVLDRDGKGVRGARVTLVHRPIGWCREYGLPDVVDADADEAGRFRAKLLPARAYSAYATWESETGPVVTRVREHVSAGAFVMLRQQESAVVALRVRVDGQQAWRGLGPLRFRILPHMANMRSMPLEAAADGTFRIPPLPGTGATLEVATRDGHTLWACRLARGALDRAGIAKRSPESTVDLQVLKLPAPVPVTVRVVDAKSGKGIAGAKIRHHSGWLAYRVNFPVLDAAHWSFDAWRPVGVTDREGRATVAIPTASDPWEKADRSGSIVLAAAAEGYAEAFAGWASGEQFYDGRKRESGEKPLRIPLHPPRPVTGRLTLDGRRPAAGVPVLLWSRVVAWNAGGGGASYWRGPLRRTRTGANGEFVFPMAPRGTGPLQIVVPLDEPGIRALLGRDGALPPLTASPFALAGARSSSTFREVGRELGATSLGSERAVLVRLVDPQGNPVRGARLSVLPERHQNDVLGMHNTTDGRGRCVLLPIDERQTVVGRVRDVGYVTSMLPASGEVTLVLKRCATLEGRLVWDDGEPAGGATIHCHGVRFAGVRRVSEPRDERLLRELAGRVNYLDTRATSDAEGRFRVEYIPSTGQILMMQVYAYRGSELRQTGFELDTGREESDGDPIEVRLTR